MLENSEEDSKNHHSNSEFSRTTFPLTITSKKTNCFLVKIKDGFVLIDTGYTSERLIIEQALKDAGCTSANINLILLTHGDFDHSGNCAYFRDKYSAKVAMHKEDSGMVEHGDFFYSRTNLNVIIKALFKTVVFLFRLNLKKKDRFKPDIYVEEGEDLSVYGFDAKIIHFPGHSKGSIGFLTPTGDLFCGDLLENTKEPSKFSLIDNHEEYNESIEKLKQPQIKTVYPGHGKPFSLEVFLKKLSS
ncbi:MAG: MBL fold metallo-hydrolase [Candidatus Heimdallarchaeota archaeon]|nr:MBL fold metallo-hydrolase [Candidatus Heimdallarchaeota archaeon]